MTLDFNDGSGAAERSGTILIHGDFSPGARPDTFLEVVKAPGESRANKHLGPRFEPRKGARFEPAAVSKACGSPPARSGFAPWRQRRIEGYLRAYLRRPLHLEDLAEHVDLSISHFCRAFRATYGMSPHNRIVGLRVEEAKGLMLSSDEPLSHIAYACGFADQSHLTRQFRRYVGQTPKAWRRSNAIEA